MNNITFKCLAVTILIIDNHKAIQKTRETEQTDHNFGFTYY